MKAQVKKILHLKDQILLVFDLGGHPVAAMSEFNSGDTILNFPYSEFVPPVIGPEKRPGSANRANPGIAPF
jgi:hypothetical protein